MSHMICRFSLLWASRHAIWKRLGFVLTLSLVDLWSLHEELAVIVRGETITSLCCGSVVLYINILTFFIFLHPPFLSPFSQHPFSMALAAQQPLPLRRYL